MSYRARERIDEGGGIVRYQNVDFFPNSIEFGSTGGVPSGGTLALLGPGNTTTGIRVPSDQKIMGASIQVNVVDALRTYNVSIRVNGIEVATLGLPISSLGSQTASLNIPVLAGDVVTIFMVRASGTGSSTFSQMRIQLMMG
jgi:hypothetical protein